MALKLYPSADRPGCGAAGADAAGGARTRASTSREAGRTSVRRSGRLALRARRLLRHRQPDLERALVSARRSRARALPAQAGGGGVYLGVGPDQNFSYIAHLRPAHRHPRRHPARQPAAAPAVQGAVSEGRDARRVPRAADRTRAAAAGRRAGIGRSTRSSPTSTAPPLRAAAIAALRARDDDDDRAFGVPLSADDHATIDRFHRRFIDGRPVAAVPQHGPPAAVRLSDVPRSAPRDRSRRARGGASWRPEDDFQFVKSLQARDLVIPIVGDLARADRAHRGRRGSSTPVDGSSRRSTRRTSSSICSATAAFRDSSTNLARLPRQPGSVIVRSVLQRAGRDRCPATTARR